MSDSNRSLDALLVIAAQDLLNEDLEIAHSIDTSHTQISNKALHRIRRMIKRYKRESWRHSVPMACRRAIAGFMIICTVSFGMCLGVEAVREEIVSTVLEWYDKFVAVFFVTEENVLDYIEEYKAPLLQVVDTEKQVIAQTENIYQVVYMAGDAVGISYQQMLISNESVDIDRENGCIQKTIAVNGSEALLFTYLDGRQTIIWQDSVYRYLLYSYSEEIETDTLILIAESVE